MTNLFEKFNKKEVKQVELQAIKESELHPDSQISVLNNTNILINELENEFKEKGIDPNIKTDGLITLDKYSTELEKDLLSNMKEEKDSIIKSN